MYDILTLKNKENELKEFHKKHFINFFQNFSYENNLTDQIRLVKINNYNDLIKVRRGSGLYFILTNYKEETNPCTLSINGLKVIYRGHGVRIRKRIESHIYNSQYNNNRDHTSYTVCMKLDNNNGLNIDTSPYKDYEWAVVYHPMSESSKLMREQAEQAFDSVYTMPLGSNA